MSKQPSAEPFGRGRPSKYKINFRSMKVGDEVHVPMNIKNRRLTHCRRASYSASAYNFDMRVSCSIFQKPGHMTVRRIK